MQNSKKSINKVSGRLRLTAFFVALSMIVTSTEAYAFPFTEAAPAEAVLPDIAIPESLGSIEETWAGTSGKMVIYIPDAHDSLEAQHCRHDSSSGCES